MIELSFVHDRKKEIKSRSDKGLIELRAYAKGQTKYFSTKVRVPQAHWNQSKQHVTNRNEEHEAMNQKLIRAKSPIDKLISDYYLKGEMLTLGIIKSELKIKEAPLNSPASFTEFIALEVKFNRFLKPNTVKQHLNSLSKLRAFKKGEINFPELNYDLTDRFLNYLKFKAYSQNTIHKHFKHLKKFIELAIKKGYLKGENPCKSIHVSPENKTREVLNMEEVALIASLNFKESDWKLKQVRDMFLFACYTGLRISDVMALKKEYLNHTEEGMELHFKTVKVNKEAHLPLFKLYPLKEGLSRPELILKEYVLNGRDLIFSGVSEQYVNRQLKLIAEMAGIKFKLTFHVGRETFGTDMAQRVPVPILRDLLQHSDFKTTV